MTAFICTLFLGVELGLAISIGLAILIVIFETAFPHIAVLGRLENTTNVYRCAKGHKRLCETMLQMDYNKYRVLSNVGSTRYWTMRVYWKATFYIFYLSSWTSTSSIIVPSLYNRNIKQYPGAEQTPGVLVVRLDAPIYFANVQWFQDKIADYEKEALT
jgi:MFS superfamily sulfate permease-like transporter